ncbi:MAG TPA: DUF302 domain-containing protein [Gemmatimonadaceae bacterium]|nr:DUF302 domain-containing protein [Gemmatimonadaceae bacterium]
MSADATAGFARTRSQYTVDQTIDRIKSLLAVKGVTLFALIDHSGEAAKVGLSLRPTKLMIFGTPRAGTPLMAAAPTIAIDLPLKVLVWQSDDGAVWIGYNEAEYIAARHGLPRALMPALAGVQALVTAAAR